MERHPPVEEEEEEENKDEIKDDAEKSVERNGVNVITMQSPIRRLRGVT